MEGGGVGRWCRIAVVVSAIVAPGVPRGAALAFTPNSHSTLECEFCHLERPRFGIDTRESVTFWRASGWDDPALCFRCHKPEENLHPLLVKPGPGALETTAPPFLPLGFSEEFAGEVVCTTCHFLHASDADWLLLRGFPGSLSPATFRQEWQALCRECHTKGLKQLSPHRGDKKACRSCHADEPTPGRPMLKSRASGLCAFCHGLMGEDHYAGVNPFETPVNCLDCHDPHLGEDYPALLRADYIRRLRNRTTLNPHYKRAFCFSCHEDKPGKPLRTAASLELCNRCHGDPRIPGDSHPLSPVPQGFKVPADWPLENGALGCTTCHLGGHPEDRDNAKFLRGGPYEERNGICWRCHRQEAFAGLSPHRDAAADKGCATCHRATPEDEYALIADVNILCLRCHTPPLVHPGGGTHTRTVAADRRASIPKDFPLFTGGRIGCPTCHDPHRGETGPKLRGSGQGAGFCALCHSF